MHLLVMAMAVPLLLATAATALETIPMDHTLPQVAEVAVGGTCGDDGVYINCERVCPEGAGCSWEEGDRCTWYVDHGVFGFNAACALDD